MENREIRKWIEVGHSGVLFMSQDIDIPTINANLYAIRVIARYNEIQRNKTAIEMSKTHTARANFNMLGGYIGFSWVKKT